MSLADVRADSTDVLSPDEVERADRFKFPEVRLAFIQGRLFLRTMLGGILHHPPGDLRFVVEGNGKPMLEGAPFAFNLSHSGGEALLAVSGSSPVGVDIEAIREERDLVGLARRYFAAQEIEELLQLAPADRVRGFYACWTRKEAFIKALGEGLSHPLDAFAVSLAPDQPPVFRTPRPRWRIFNLDVGDLYAAAVVVPATVQRARCFRVNSLESTP